MGNILTYSDFVSPLRDNYAQQFAGYPNGDQMADVMAQQAMMQVLEKGLEATGALAGDGTTGADALKLQDIGRQLAVAELRMKNHAPLWNSLMKVPAYSDVVELTRLDKFGGFRRGGFLDETRCDGGLVPTDPSLIRKTTPIKWAGGRYMVSRTALALRTMGMNNVDPAVGNVEDVASTARLEQLVLNLNELAWFGDNSVNPHEPNGVIKQIREANTYAKPTRINLNGQPLTIETMADIEQTLRSKGAIWTDFWWGPGAFADMRKQLINFTRIQSGVPVPIGNYADEYLITSWAGQPGKSRFHQDLMLDTPAPDDKFPAGITAPVRPSAVTVAAVADSAGNAWGTKLPAGTYFYSVAAVGVNGRSNVRAAATSVTPNGTTKVEVTITNTDILTQFFEVYRGTTANNRQYLGRVSAQGLAMDDTVVFTDNGEYIPGAAVAIAMSNNQQPGGGINGAGTAEVMIRQLYPISKVVLPVNVMCVEAAWIVAFTPQVLTPSFDVVIENIGRLV